jgi:hypothetical protein
MKYINETEKFWDHSFRIHTHAMDAEGYLVNANHAQHALDILVDYLEERGELGLVLVDPEFYSAEELEELFYNGELANAGNHCHLVHIANIAICEID